MNERKHHFRMTDAFEFMAWINNMHPQVFKEWVALKDIERSVEDDYEEVQEYAPEE